MGSDFYPTLIAYSPPNQGPPPLQLSVGECLARTLSCFAPSVSLLLLCSVIPTPNWRLGLDSSELPLPLPRALYTYEDGSDDLKLAASGGKNSSHSFAFLSRPLLLFSSPPAWLQATFSCLHPADPHLSGRVPSWSSLRFPRVGREGALFSVGL